VVLVLPEANLPSQRALSHRRVQSVPFPLLRAQSSEDKTTKRDIGLDLDEDESGRLETQLTANKEKAVMTALMSALVTKTHYWGALTLLRRTYRAFSTPP
jgi:hypothetical protein